MDYDMSKIVMIKTSDCHLLFNMWWFESLESLETLTLVPVRHDLAKILKWIKSKDHKGLKDFMRKSADVIDHQVSASQIIFVLRGTLELPEQCVMNGKIVISIAVEQDGDDIDITFHTDPEDNHKFSTVTYYAMDSKYIEQTKLLSGHVRFL